jgi:hypothetical protein
MCGAAILLAVLRLFVEIKGSLILVLWEIK